jgi:putative tricarboxylic transport membrane protein
MKRNDIVTSVFHLILAAVLIWQALSIPVGRFGKPGPGFLPLGVGLVLAALSLSLWIEARSRKSPQEKISFLAGEGRWPGVVWTVALLSAYGLLLEWLGFIICTLSILFLLFRFIGKQRLPLAVAETILITLVAHLLFKVALKVQLPGGLFRI